MNATYVEIDFFSVEDVKVSLQIEIKFFSHIQGNCGVNLWYLKDSHWTFNDSIQILIDENRTKFGNFSDPSKKSIVLCISVHVHMYTIVVANYGLLATHGMHT